MTKIRKASCLCGKCTYQFESEKLEVWVCHCSFCQKWAGWPLMSIHVECPVDIAAVPELTWYESSEWGMRAFCNNCGSNLAWATKDKAMLMPIAWALEDKSDLKMHTEVFIDEKPEYYDFANKTNKMTWAECFAAFWEGNK